jgi:hypothetical protein
LVEAFAPAESWDNTTIPKAWPGGRAEQTKLTACRKVWRMYRRDSPKSRRKRPRNRGFGATDASSRSAAGRRRPARLGAHLSILVRLMSDRTRFDGAARTARISPSTLSDGSGIHSPPARPGNGELLACQLAFTHAGNPEHTNAPVIWYQRCRSESIVRRQTSDIHIEMAAGIAGNSGYGAIRPPPTSDRSSDIRCRRRQPTRFSLPFRRQSRRGSTRSLRIAQKPRP